jgi:EmrB/QacA subfamily drug resistance transporter
MRCNKLAQVAIPLREYGSGQLGKNGERNPRHLLQCFAKGFLDYRSRPLQSFAPNPHAAASVILMKTPCDESLVLSARGSALCDEARRPWILAGTILGSSMAFVDSTVVNVAVPVLQTNFNASVFDVQWVVESYGILLSALILAGGALGDLLGRRRMFVTGVGIFAIASLACGVAASIHQLIIARCIQGLGAALLVPGSLAIISASFDEDSRGQAIGTWSGFTAITSAFGPVLGGWLIQHASWRWAFLLNLPLAVAVVVISLRCVPESRNSEANQIDWVGALLATAGLAGVVTAFLESARLGWSHPLVLTGLLGGFLLLAAFLAAEAHLRSPMVPLRLFRSHAFLGANVFTLLLYATLGIFFFLFPMALIQEEGYSPTAAGSAMLPTILLIFLLSRWSGGLVKRYGGKIPLIVGPLVVAAGFVLFAVLGGGSYWRSYFPASLVLGLGMAITVAPLTTVVMASVDQQHAGAASGINNAVARVAGVLAIAVLGSVMVRTFDSHLERGLTKMRLPPNVIEELRSREGELHRMEPPQGLDSNIVSGIRGVISESFMAGFRLVLLCCAGLSIGSVVVAAWLIAGAAPASSKL